MQQVLQLPQLFSSECFVRVKVHLLKKQDEPFLIFLPDNVCVRVTVAGVGKDLPELKALFH